MLEPVSTSARPESPRTTSVPGADELNDLLWECAAYVELMGESALAGSSLTLASNGMLNTVQAEPGITIAEIARRKPKSQQAVSQVVARLEKLGLLQRRLGSGRGVGLHVTDAGREMAVTGAAREAELRVRLRELLGDDRYETLERLLGEARAILRETR